MITMDCTVEDAGDGGFGHQLFGRAGGSDGAVAQEDQPIGIAGGRVQIVQDQNHGAAEIDIELAHQIEAIELVGHVEVIDRLVEADHVGFLRQHHGDPDALQLAAGE
ncbi:hypothetical protein N8D56_01015 [Devosia sp. A8/3-2]|nr:hypothetical protein N8D56_01015 [Devosia sp. A8/3-2]